MLLFFVCQLLSLGKYGCVSCFSLVPSFSGFRAQREESKIKRKTIIPDHTWYQELFQYEITVEIQFGSMAAQYHLKFLATKE